MRRHAFALLSSLLIGAGLTSAARGDERVEEPGTWRSPPRADHAPAYRPRRIVREVVRERPVYRTVYRTRPVVREVVREVVVERPVYVRPRPVYEDVFVEGPYGPPPRFYGPRFYGPRFFRPRPVLAYGPGFGPGYGPFGPRRFGWGGGYGPGPFY